MSSEHPTPQAEAKPFDPARMNAQTARLMASDMAALAGAMFRLLQPQAAAEREAEPTATAPQAATAAAPEPPLPVPGLALPGLDLQPETTAAPPTAAEPGFAVPAIDVPGLAVPGTQPPREESTLADFDLDPEPQTDPEDEAYDVPELAEEPPSYDADESDVASPRSQALLDEIAFLDD